MNVYKREITNIKNIASFIVLLFSVSCQNSNLSFKNLNSSFIENRENYEQVASFLEKKSENYDFASLSLVENKIRLTLGNKGIETSSYIKDSELPSDITKYIWKEKGSFIKYNQIILFQLEGTKKHGIERSSGILKHLSIGQPKITFSWVQSYEVNKLDKNWFAYKINPIN